MPFYLYFLLIYIKNVYSTSITIILTPIPPYIACTPFARLPIDSLFYQNHVNSSFKGLFFEIIANTLIYQGNITNIEGEFMCVETVNFSEFSNNFTFFIGNYSYNKQYLPPDFNSITPIYELSTPLLSYSSKYLLSVDIWPFLSPLTVSNSIIFLLIGLITAVFIYIFEEKQKKIELLHIFRIIKEIFGSIFVGNCLYFKSWASRISLYIWWLICYIFFMVYICYLSMRKPKEIIEKHIFVGIYQGFSAEMKKYLEFSLLSYENSIEYKMLRKQYLEHISMNSSIMIEGNNLIGMWVIVICICIILSFFYFSGKIALFNNNFYLKRLKNCLYQANYMKKEGHNWINQEIEAEFQENFIDATNSNIFCSFTHFF